ncbi:MAG: MFS transporter [Coxiellaceae bacterium]|nr:MFS transporter [Coxiellaceae bacterium]
MNKHIGKTASDFGHNLLYNNLMIQNKHSAKASTYAWYVLALSSLFLFYKYLTQVFPSVITHELLVTFHLDGTSLGVLAACFFYSYLVVQIFSGVILDKYNTKWILIACTAIAAVGSILFSYAHTFETAAFARILMGIGAAFATVGYMKIATLFFKPEQFGVVGGLLTTGVCLGAVFGQAPLSLLINTYSWRTAIFIIGVIGFIICIVFACTVFFHKNKRVKSLDSMTWADFKAVMHSRKNWLLTAYSGLAFAPMAVFGGLWGIPFMLSAYHLPRTDTSALMSLSYIGLGIGGPLFGYIAGKINRRYAVMKFGLILCFITLGIVIYLTSNYIVLAIMLFLFGLGIGAFMLGFAEGKDTNPLHMAASVIALINTGDAFFGAVTQPLVGKLMDFTRHHINPHADVQFNATDYRYAFISLMVILVLAYISLVLAQRCKK